MIITNIYVHLGYTACMGKKEKKHEQQIIKSYCVVQANEIPKEEQWLKLFWEDF